jgi:hypothetical protein
MMEMFQTESGGLKNNDITTYGICRTKEMILAINDRMAAADAANVRYESTHTAAQPWASASRTVGSSSYRRRESAQESIRTAMRAERAGGPLRGSAGVIPVPRRPSRFRVSCANGSQAAAGC